MTSNQSQHGGAPGTGSEATGGTARVLTLVTVGLGVVVGLLGFAPQYTADSSFGAGSISAGAYSAGGSPVGIGLLLAAGLVAAVGLLPRQTSPTGPAAGLAVAGWLLLLFQVLGSGDVSLGWGTWATLGLGLVLAAAAVLALLVESGVVPARGRATGAPGQGSAAFGGQGHGGQGYGGHESGSQGYGNPGYGNPSYGNPSYGNPSYGNPSYGNPSYGNPSYGNPSYGGEGHGGQGYGGPGYGGQGYGGQESGSPGYGSQGYTPQGQPSPGFTPQGPPRQGYAPQGHDQPGSAASSGGRDPGGQHQQPGQPTYGQPSSQPPPPSQPWGQPGQVGARWDDEDPATSKVARPDAGPDAPPTQAFGAPGTEDEGRHGSSPAGP